MQGTIHSVLSMLLVLALGGWYATPARGEWTEVQKDLLRQTLESLRLTGTHYKNAEYAAAAEHLMASVGPLQKALAEAEEADFQSAQTLFRRIERHHALLQLEGIVLPPFDPPQYGQPWDVHVDPNWKPTTAKSAAPLANTPKTSTSKTRPPKTRPPKTRPTKTTAPEPTGISFAKQVAPILAAHCGKCHIQDRKGKFSLGSYALLMQGPPEGVVVFAGDPVGSRLIETIETGDMPRGGGSVPGDQLQVLKDWVAQGARFDGPGPAVPLVNYAAPLPAGPATPAANAPSNAPAGPPMPATASGGETVSFARQVAPLLVENCGGCHVDAMQARGRLNMSTLAQLLRGGDSGPALTPGDGDGSLLVRKLRGQEGTRMPAGGRPPLSDESIQLISTWISEGAKLQEESSPDQPLRVMVMETWAKHATPEELSARRREMAHKNWTLGAPEDARDLATEAENDDVFAIGNVLQETADQAAKAGSAALQKAAAAVFAARSKPKAGEGRFKGRITLFLFPRRYAYSEFAKMVEAREIPTHWNEHWRFDGVDAYIAMVVSPEDDPQLLEARLTGPMASLLIASRGESPHWFREGIGRAVAARLGGRNFVQSKTWDAELKQAAAMVKEPKELTGEKLPPEQADLIGYGLAQVMLDRKFRKSFDALLAQLDEGTPFDEAFASSYPVPLENYIMMWFAWYATQR